MEVTVSQIYSHSCVFLKTDDVDWPKGPGKGIFPPKDLAKTVKNYKDHFYELKTKQSSSLIGLFWVLYWMFTYKSSKHWCLLGKAVMYKLLRRLLHPTPSSSSSSSKRAAVLSWWRRAVAASQPKGKFPQEEALEAAEWTFFPSYTEHGISKVIRDLIWNVECALASLALLSPVTSGHTALNEVIRPNQVKWL